MTDDMQGVAAPLDCKHGQLRRQCQLCELEAEEHILRYGCVIEVAIRNSNVAEWMRHWEDRATKAEASIVTLLAEKVAAVLAEREACAAMCERRAASIQPSMVAACNQCARDIRARATGEKGGSNG